MAGERPAVSDLLPPATTVDGRLPPDQELLPLAVALPVCLLLLLLLVLLLAGTLCCLRRRRRTRRQRQYQELQAAAAPVPEGSAPVIPVSPCCLATKTEIPFAVPPRFTTQNQCEAEGKRMAVRRDVLAHRGSLSVSRWFPVGTLRAGLYSDPPLGQVVAPPPGMATRLCFSVEYRPTSEQLTVSLLRLANLPPHFHGNVTLVEVWLLPDDRRPRQAKARGTGPDPEFSDCFIFQVSVTCVSQSTLSVCVLSVKPDGKRQAVGRVLFPLEGELGQAGRVLWRELEEEDVTQGSELGDVLVSLCYSPSLQRLSVMVLRGRGLRVLTGTGVCVQVSLQIHSQVVKVKNSHVVKGESDPYFSHRMTFKLRPQHLEEACLRLELQQTNDSRSDPPTVLGVLVLGPFMYARGPQLQHWMDMVSTPQEPLKRWHRLNRAR